ncbi:MAG: hypothetical protein IJJ33_18135 [Victivallales bacterium]|nr:hypothetical protein [Victivallales bacterium]
MNVVGALDIGSNTVKLAVYETDGTAFALVHESCRTTRLGEGLRGRLLAADSRQRTVSAIRHILAVARERFPQMRLVGVATSAVREADNGQAFLAEVTQACHLDCPPLTLTGIQEAELTFRGASLSFPGGQTFLNVDPGGGSTECAFGQAGNAPTLSRSLKIGCGRWCDRYALAGCAQADQLETAYKAALEVFQTLREGWGASALPSGVSVSVTGGTAHAVASLLAEKVYPFEQPMPQVRRDALRPLLHRLASLDTRARQSLPGMPEARAAIMPAGVIIILAALEVFHAPVFLPNPYGLRAALVRAAQHAALPLLLRGK